MTQYKRRRLWTGISAFALLAPIAACSDETPDNAVKDQPAEAPPQASVPAFLEGGEGAGGEGGEGGEMGVSAELAAKDPVTYLIALDVIRAHYYAGQAAYEVGQREAAAEMFVHPIAEIYVGLEDVFAQRGAPAFDGLMMTAGNRAFDGAEPDSVEAAADAVLAAVDSAEEKAPRSALSEAEREARVIANMIERAARQYRLVTGGGAGEAYLDGFGYYWAAQERANRKIGIIRDASEDVAAEMEQALALLAQTYPSVLEPGQFEFDASEILAASSSLALELSAL